MPIHPVFTILKSLSPLHLAALGAKNIQVSSPRSIRFDLPDGKAKDGINRIKLTAINDKVNIQFLQVTEIDLLGGVELGGIIKAIENFTGITAKQ